MGDPFGITDQIQREIQRQIGGAVREGVGGVLQRGREIVTDTGTASLNEMREDEPAQYNALKADLQLLTQGGRNAYKGEDDPTKIGAALQKVARANGMNPNDVAAFVSEDSVLDVNISDRFLDTVQALATAKRQMGGQEQGQGGAPGIQRAPTGRNR